MPYAHELELAIAAARSAGAVLNEHFGLEHDVHYKGLVDPVTEADKASEEIILKHIREAFPDDEILSEEGGGGRPDVDAAHRLWIIDPLDGTVNFMHGFPWFCVSVALQVGDTVQVGVVYDSQRDELFAAVRGHGATLNGEPIAPSTTDDLIHAMLGTGFLYDTDKRAENLRYVAEFLGETQALRRAGSAALDVTYVACGRLDGYWERGVAAWDIAAGALFVVETGGQLSNYAGEPFDIFGREILASNGRLHASMLAVIAAIRADLT